MTVRRATSGLEDKLYWRAGPDSVFHCFKREIGSKGGRPARCVSLCGKVRIPRSGGQASRRPEPVFRCGRCDGLEANRRGWDESGPTLIKVVAVHEHVKAIRKHHGA